MLTLSQLERHLFAAADILRGRMDGMDVYDPCAGAGGMLVHAKEYVERRGATCSPSPAAATGATTACCPTRRSR